MQKVLVHIGGNYVLYFWDVIAFSARKQGEEITNGRFPFFFRKIENRCIT